MTADDDPLVLGIDIGTGSTKAVLCRTNGTVLATAAREHRTSTPRPGRVEMDAEDQWWAEVGQLSHELLAGVPAEAVRGVCVSGMGPCLVLTDADHRPLAPAVLYGVDSRAQQEIRDLEAEVGPDVLLARCGAMLSTQAVGPKLRWARDHQADVWRRARHWHGTSSFVVARLTGEVAMDHHTASQCDPLYDLRTRDWSRDVAWSVVEHLPLPRLVDAGEVVGTVHAVGARATGLAAGTPVVAGTIDAWAEAHSAGVREPGDAMLMYGSTTFVVAVQERLSPLPPLWTTAGTDPGSYSLAGGTSSAGSLTRWVRDLTGGPSFEALIEEARGVGAGSDGLLVLPYFAGERTPVFDPAARGVVAGLTLQHTRAHLFRACLEGIGFGITRMLDLFDGAPTPVRRLVAVGGGTRGGLWTQIVSDISGRTQHLPEQTIGASYGAALLAAAGTGLVPPETTWARTRHQVTPDPAAHDAYRRLAPLFDDLYPATRDVVHALVDLEG